MGKNKAARKAAPDFESRTYESLMAAARAAKTIEQKRGVLIQLNEVSGSKFKPSTPQRAQDFVQRLARVGVEATIRNSRGSDIDAACGQLRQRMGGK